ncbi:MAG: hypothetical protein VX816_02900 [Actinomycetota bacterium]|nr:hypothetical protein [Actinomycetota bacterium]
MHKSYGVLGSDLELLTDAAGVAAQTENDIHRQNQQSDPDEHPNLIDAFEGSELFKRLPLRVGILENFLVYLARVAVGHRYPRGMNPQHGTLPGLLPTWLRRNFLNLFSG